MKIIYNNKVISNTQLKYDDLKNTPKLNDNGNVTPISGMMSLDDLNTMSRGQIDTLLASLNNIECGTSLPSPTHYDTLYYIGPKTDLSYDVYLTNKNNELTKLGNTSDIPYSAGNGITLNLAEGRAQLIQPSGHLLLSVLSSSRAALTAQYIESYSRDSDVHRLGDDDYLATSNCVWSADWNPESGAYFRTGMVPAAFGNNYYDYLSGNAVWRGVYVPMGAEKCGLVPPPKAGQQNCILSSSSEWVDPSTESGFVISSKPVGTVYYTVLSTNPGDLFGGTWEKIENSYILCKGDSTPATGGSNSVALTSSQTNHRHKVTGNKYSMSVENTIMGHSHGVFHHWNTAKKYNLSPHDLMGTASGDGSWTESATHTHTLNINSAYISCEQQGTGQSHNNMHPYFVVNAWKRTA